MELYDRLGWHFPITAHDVARRMPCFRDGMQEADANYRERMSHIDPAVAQQSDAATQSHGAFGISRFWVIIFLAGIVAIFALAVPSRRRLVKGPDPALRAYRKPSLFSVRGRRRPRLPKKPSERDPD